MSFIDKIDPSIAKLIADGAEAIVKLIWEKIIGSKPGEDVSKVIGEVKDRVIESQVEAAIVELRARLEALGLAIAFEDLDDAIEKTLASIKAAEKSPTVPVLDIELEEVEEITKPE